MLPSRSRKSRPSLSRGSSASGCTPRGRHEVSPKPAKRGHNSTVDDSTVSALLLRTVDSATVDSSASTVAVAVGILWPLPCRADRRGWKAASRECRRWCRSETPPRSSGPAPRCHCDPSGVRGERRSRKRQGGNALVRVGAMASKSEFEPLAGATGAERQSLQRVDRAGAGRPRGRRGAHRRRDSGRRGGRREWRAKPWRFQSR